MELLSYEKSFLFLCHTDARTHASNIIHNRQRERERVTWCLCPVFHYGYIGARRERETSDFRWLLYLGHRPIYKPQNTKLNYALRKINKTYKKQDKQDKYQQTNKKQTKKRRKTKQKKSGTSHTEIMRHYGGR